MAIPTIVALDADANVTIFMIRLQLETTQALAEELSAALDEIPTLAEHASFEAIRGPGHLQIRIRARPHSAEHALRAALRVISGKWPSVHLPMSVIGRGCLVGKAISLVDWPSNIVPANPQRASLSPGAHFSSSGGRLHGQVTFAAALATARTYAFQNVVASVWIGTRDSVVMQRLRERAGLVYFPFMAYNWHSQSPSWSIAFQAEATAEAVVRRELRLASEMPAPVGDFAMHLRNAVRSLDVVEISPEAHLALGQQLADRGLTGDWIEGFRHILVETTAKDFASEWESMMTDIQEALNA